MKKIDAMLALEILVLDIFDVMVLISDCIYIYTVTLDSLLLAFFKTKIMGYR